MKHYILLSVEVPPSTEYEKEQHWLTLAQQLAERAKSTKGIVMLAPNVWLLPRDSGMLFAAECMAVAQRRSLKTEARFLSADD